MDLPKRPPGTRVAPKKALPSSGRPPTKRKTTAPSRGPRGAVRANIDGHEDTLAANWALLKAAGFDLGPAPGQTPEQERPHEDPLENPEGPWVDLSLDTEVPDALSTSILADASAMLRALNLSSAELSLVICGDSQIHALNRQWRGKDAPTDVLSFPQEEGETPNTSRRSLGDLVISVDTARRQGEELGHGLAAELKVLLVHGMLHLLGMDHERGPAEAEAMALREQELLPMIGGPLGLISRTGEIG